MLCGILVCAALLLTGCSAARAASNAAARTATTSATPMRTVAPSPAPARAAAFAALTVGDCLNTPAGSDEPEDLGFDVVPCAGSHASEVFGLPIVGSKGYPGDDEVTVASEDACGTLFTSYVGVSVYSTTSLDYSVYTPGQSDWAAGHRRAACVIFSPNGNIVGSVKGIGAGTPRTTP